MSKQKVFKSKNKALRFCNKVNGNLKEFVKIDNVKYVVRYKSTSETKSHAKNKRLINESRYYKPKDEYYN